MPAILERCVTKVMGKGHDKSSAWAICRSSLGLNENGSEDQIEKEMTDEEMDKSIAAGYPMNPEATTQIKKAADAPGAGADTGKDSLPTPKAGPATPNPQGNPSPDNRVALQGVPPVQPIGSDARPTVSAEDAPSPAPKSAPDAHQRKSAPMVIHKDEDNRPQQPNLENVPEEREGAAHSGGPGALPQSGSQIGMSSSGVTPAAPRGEGATGPASTSQTNIQEDGKPLLRAATASTRDLIIKSMRNLGKSEEEIAVAATVFFSAPSLAPHMKEQVEVGKEISFPIEPRNFTGDTVTVKAEPFPMPPNAHLEHVDGKYTFCFKPDASQIGAYDFVFTASDGIQQLSQSIIVVVVAPDVTKQKLPEVGVGEGEVGDPKTELTPMPEVAADGAPGKGAPNTVGPDGKPLPPKIGPDGKPLPPPAETAETPVEEGTETPEEQTAEAEAGTEKPTGAPTAAVPTDKNAPPAQKDAPAAPADKGAKPSPFAKDAPAAEAKPNPFAKKKKAASESFNPLPFVKDIVVAHAGRNFSNGLQEFDLTRENIDEIIKNFNTQGKQVPLLLTPDHVFGGKKSDIPASGWVEAMYRNNDEWHARVKFVGEAARLILQDQFRGVSIGTVMGRDVHGKPVGEMLDHLLITNAPFFPHLNIAASESASSVGKVRYISALKETPTMADSPVVVDVASKALIAAKESEIISLKAMNLQLNEKVETLEAALSNYVPSAEKEALQKEVSSLRRETFAMKIRALVDSGIAKGTLKPAWCEGYGGKNALDLEGTLRWLKASRFYDALVNEPEKQAFDILKWAVDNNQPIYRLGKTHASGEPGMAKGLRALTEEEKKLCKAVGADPDRIAAMPDGCKLLTQADWQELKAAKEGK